MNNTQPKSGFEIRAELLSQAQSLLEGNLYRSNDAVVQHNDSFPNDKKPWGEQVVSTEDVFSCLINSSMENRRRVRGKQKWQ